MPGTFVPFVNCAEVVIRGLMADQEVLLTLGAFSPDGWDFAHLGELADQIANWCTENLLPVLVDDLTINEVVATDLTTNTGPQAVSIVGLPASGGVVGIPVTNNTAFVMSFKTAARGRSFRGRNYVPSVRSDRMTDSSNFNDSVVNEMNSVYNELPSFFEAVSASHVVLSRFSGGVPRTTGVSTEVMQYIGRHPVGSQRRRVTGRGR